MHYLLFYEVIPGFTEARAPLRAEHLALAQQAVARGDLVLGGALADPVDGAVLLFQGESPEAATRFAEADPYVRHGMVTRWHVRPWNTVVGDSDSGGLPAARMLVAETVRLRIRHFNLEDAEFVMRLLNEPSFIKFIGDKGVRTLVEARAYLLTGPLAGYARFGFGLNCVELKESGAPIGMCGVLKRDTLPDPDLGYAFLPEYWSSGYAFEAAAAIMHHARDTFGLPRLLAVTTADNAASIRLLEKAGFQYTGPVRMPTDAAELKLFSADLSRHAVGPREHCAVA